MRLLEGVWLEDSQMECENVGSSEPGLQREIVEMRERERGTERERERESLCIQAKHPREVLILGLALSSGSAS